MKYRGDTMRKLLAGDFGLAKTYWLFWFLAGAPLYIGAMIQGTALAFMLYCLALTPYHVVIWIAVWNAANKYQGSDFWYWLAKIVVIFSILVNVIQVVWMTRRAW
jgi:hypothetical protein